LPVKIVAAGSVAVYIMPPRKRAATDTNKTKCPEGREHPSPEWEW
jgi:hypothetical protein